MTDRIEVPTVRVDFHNADSDGFVRLNVAGAVADLTRLGLVLTDGDQLRVTDGEIAVLGTVRPPGPEGVWRLQVDWAQVFHEHGKR